MVNKANIEAPIVFERHNNTTNRQANVQHWAISPMALCSRPELQIGSFNYST